MPGADATQCSLIRIVGFEAVGAVSLAPGVGGPGEVVMPMAGTNRMQSQVVRSSREAVVEREIHRKQKTMEDKAIEEQVGGGGVTTVSLLTTKIVSSVRARVSVGQSTSKDLVKLIKGEHVRALPRLTVALGRATIEETTAKAFLSITGYFGQESGSLAEALVHTSSFYKTLSKVHGEAYAAMQHGGPHA